MRVCRNQHGLEHFARNCAWFQKFITYDDFELTQFIKGDKLALGGNGSVSPTSGC
jgi:hypothetical protein